VRPYQTNTYIQDLIVKLATASSTQLTPHAGRPAHVCAFVFAGSIGSLQVARNLHSMNSASSLSISKTGHQLGCADQTKPGEGRA
jgi:hypothetical protein